MRRAARVLHTAVFAAVAAAVLGTSPPSASADGMNEFGPHLEWTDGSLVRTWITVRVRVPPAPRLYLVQSGVPAERAQRVRLRLRRGAEDEPNTLSGFTTRRLVAERTYDVVIQSGRKVCGVLPAAFTAHAPKLTLGATSASRGEKIYAFIENGSGPAKFRIGGLPARVTGDGSGGYVIEIPRDLPRHASQADVSVTTARRRVAAPAPLAILQEREVFSAFVDGVEMSSDSQSYATSPNVRGSYPGPRGPSPQVYVTGARSRGFRVGGATQSLEVRIPVDLATATFPLTVTRDDGVQISWHNQGAEDRNGNIRAWLPGPRGWFRGLFDGTVTLESMEGSRIKGTFSARLIETDRWGQFEPGGREIEITDGRFEVEPE